MKNSVSLIKDKKSENDRYAYRYIYPGLIFLLVVLIAPLVFSVITSFFQWDLIGFTDKKFIGFKNYVQVFKNEETLNSFWVTIKFLFATITMEMLIGYLVALFLNRPFKFRKLVRVIVIMPMMLSPTIVALMWKMILNSDRGVMNYILESIFGRSAYINWFGPKMALFTLILVDVWLNMPFVALMVLAGLQGISTDIIEASRVDGANSWQRNWYITMPLMQPVLLVALIFRTTFNLREFPLPWILTSGGPANLTNVFGVELYRQAFSYYHLGYSSALSWILIIITFALSVCYTRMTLGPSTKDKKRRTK